MSEKAVGWSVAIIAVLGFTILHWGQCSHENQLEKDYNDAVVIMDYFDELVDQTRGHVEYERWRVFSGLQSVAHERYWNAAWELARFRQTRWWNQGAPPGELDRRY